LLQPIPSLSDAANAVQGRWQVCQGLSNLVTTNWAPSDTVGMEFTTATPGGGSCPGWGGSAGCVGGLIYFLVQGSSGLVRGQTNAYQIWYSIIPTGNAVQLNLNHTPTQGSWGTSISVSASPRELYVETLNYMNGARMVAVP
jgi:hypothetical protein